MAKVSVKGPVKPLKQGTASNHYKNTKVTLKGPNKGISTMPDKKPTHKRVPIAGPRTAGKVG